MTPTKNPPVKVRTYHQKKDYPCIALPKASFEALEKFRQSESRRVGVHLNWPQFFEIVIKRMGSPEES